MVNNYSFNLDNDVLEHGAIGAHYSKNWSRQKQNEYNRWYYQTHKAEIARSRSRVQDARNELDAAKYKDKVFGANRKQETNDYRWFKVRYEYSNNADSRSLTESQRKRYELAKSLQKETHKDVLNKKKKLEAETKRNKNAVTKSKSLVANMIAFDVSRNVSKATKAISKTLKNIKNKIIG